MVKTPNQKHGYCREGYTGGFRAEVGRCGHLTHVELQCADHTPEGLHEDGNLLEAQLCSADFDLTVFQSTVGSLRTGHRAQDHRLAHVFPFIKRYRQS